MTRIPTVTTETHRAVGEWWEVAITSLITQGAKKKAFWRVCYTRQTAAIETEGVEVVTQHRGRPHSSLGYPEIPGPIRYRHSCLWLVDGPREESLGALLIDASNS